MPRALLISQKRRRHLRTRSSISAIVLTLWSALDSVKQCEVGASASEPGAGGSEEVRTCERPGAALLNSRIVRARNVDGGLRLPLEQRRDDLGLQLRIR